MAASPVSCLLDHHLLLLPIHEKQKECRACEEDAIHDAERKRRLQHRALLIDVEAERRVPAEAIRAQGDVEGSIGAEMAAVGVGDAAEVVDAGDEGPDEKDVYEADEVGRAAGRFAAKECQEAPHRCKGRDNKEDSEVGISCALELRTRVARTGHRRV